VERTVTESAASEQRTSAQSEPIPTVVPERHLTPEFPDAPHGVAFIGDAPPKPARPRRHKPRQTELPLPKPQVRQTFPLLTLVSALRTLSVTFAAAVMAATIFMWWTSPDFLPAQARRDLAPVQATARLVAFATPTLLPTPIWYNRIGILAGHSGMTAPDGSRREQPDPGAVCPDGFYERSVTEAVAERAAAILRARGYTVDILEEFDPRLNGYEAAAFVSLHADSCANFGYGGYKSTYPAARTLIRDQDIRLNECIRLNYESLTGLPFQPGSITDNMLLYHAFRKIGVRTPANILELGFLSYDRDLLQNQPDRVALAVANGILCFLEPQAP
jgi:hypothetical protein